MNVGWTKHVFLVSRETKYNADDKTRLYGSGSDVGVSTRTGLGSNQYRELSARSGDHVVSAHGTNSLSEWSNLVPADNWSNVQVGDQVCSYLALDNKWAVFDGRTVNSTIASNVKCVRIGKNPQMQINGSDSYAKNGFIGSSTTNSGRGSWVQYAQLTNSGETKNFGSAGYTWSKGNNSRRMIFANVRFATDYSGAASSVQSGGLTANNSISIIVNKLKIKSNGNSQIEYSSGSLTINSNIDDGKIRVAEGNIYIRPSVTHIRGVLVAGGSIETCYDSGKHG